MPWVEQYDTRSGKRFRVAWRDREGKRHSRTFLTEADAHAFAETVGDPGEYRARRALSNLVGERIDAAIKEARGPTLVDYLREIIDADHSLRVSTREGYESVIRTHLHGTPIGSRPISAIEPRHVRQYFADRKDLGPGARRNVHQTLVKAFTAAVREGLIDRSPLYAAGIKRPSKDRQKDIEPLTVAQVVALQENAPDAMLGLAIKVSAMTGLRAGEVGGLRVQDVDFERCRIHVRQATHRSKGARGIGPLKTKAARRNIAVPCSVLGEVADFLLDNPAAGDGRIFTAKREQGYLTDVRLNAAVHEAAGKAGIRDGNVHFHELRHTYASLLVAASANIKALQYAMGHTDSRTTTDLYIHLYPDADQTLADALEARLEEHRNGSAA